MTHLQRQLDAIKVVGTAGRISALDLAVDLARIPFGDGRRTQAERDLRATLKGTPITVAMAEIAGDAWIDAEEG